MADDKVLREDDLDVIEVEELPKPGETPSPEHEDDDDDPPEEEDTRLAEHEDDEDDTKPGEDSVARKKRLSRRKIRNEARDRTIRELNDLKAWKASVEPQLAALQTNSLNINESAVDAKLNEVRRDIESAEQIHAKAIEAGNGADAVAALRLRDESKVAEGELLRAKATFAEARKPKPATADPAVVAHSTQWKSANAGWYGSDADATKAANQLDAQVLKDGYNPATPAYWQELTRRVKNHFGVVDTKPATNGRAPRRAAPQGGQSEHAPASTRNEVYVTPERKQAMIDAGIWDDPQRRAKTLKAYAEFDRDQSAGR